jgi:dihydrofolate reductase
VRRNPREVIAELSFQEGESSLAERGSASLAVQKRASGGWPDFIGSCLDEAAIDEFIITVVPTFIGEGIPLLAPRHREVALRLLGVQQFPDGVVQLHYEVQRSRV